MHTGKILVGNSGDKVYLQDNLVIKEAGHYPEKFKQQMDWLSNCDHPNFIKINPISEVSYEMDKHPTWFDKICSQKVSTSLLQLERLLSIVDNFDHYGRDVDTPSYLEKLQLRTGYTYEGNLDAVSCWGFVHGDLTISNILHNEDFIFIDPRGTEEQDYYDYGKLMQSFVMKYESHIYNNNNDDSYLDLNESIIDLSNNDIYSTMTTDYDKNIEMLDITNNILPDICNNTKSKITSNSKLNKNPTINNKSHTNSQSGSESDSESGSYCSSRTSNTSISDCSNNDSDYESDSETESETESCSDSNSDSDSDSDNDSEILVSINKFPVQLICLECCDDTLDNFIMNNKINDKVWESIILQILFTLIIYQKCFDFTHNDLHTNNIVYVNTEKKYLYYKYDNVHYKVPTYGKIFKIIDFGRAAYTVNNKFIISDSYDLNGDAHSQYNCEPFYDKNKSIVNPNFSFDLCRLSCSIFDYFVDDLDDIVKLKSPIKKLIISWIFDDKNRNILYKNNGDERYPDFKLYKMIARTVTKHIPCKVIKNVIFNKYNIAKKNINKPGSILNIDNLPVFTK